MLSPQELLAQHGIGYIHTAQGKYTTDCPHCRGDGYLNVVIERDGAKWFCHNCDEGGGDKFEKPENGNLGPIKKTYNYTDENGNLLFQVLRFEPLGQLKQFRQRTGPDQQKCKGVRIVPYRLPELIEDIALDYVIFVVEGEKDVDTLRRHRVPATCNPMGAGKWWPEFNEILRGADVVICGDNDQPGRAHVNLVANNLHGLVGRLRILDLAKFCQEIEESDDVTDWLQGGGTPEKLWEIVDQLPDYQANGHATSPLWPASQKRPLSPVQAAQQEWRARIVTANDLQAMTFPPVRHIVPGYISEGATIIAGKPKIGKSWLTLDLCFAATSDRFTLGTLKPVQGDVLYLALEDNNRRLKRRMAKICPSKEARWPKRLALVTDWKRADEGGLDDIEDWCRSVADPVMVVIDTLEKFRPIQNGKSNAYSADYAAVTGLQKIAGTHRIAVVINHHVRKMEADDPFDTVSGTLGLTGAADTIIVLKRHAGAVTLHARGRDIEEVETALQFERATCRWTILGTASEVYVSNERAAVLSALVGAGSEGLAVSEIMAATGSKSRGAMDVLLFQMKKEGAVQRLKRGVYAIPQDATKIAKKERNSGHIIDNNSININLSDLSDLSGPAEPEREAVQ